MSQSEFQITSGQASSEQIVEERFAEHKASQIFFDSKTSWNEHAIILHGQIFATEETHNYAHKVSNVFVKTSTQKDLHKSESLKVGDLMLIRHYHNEKGYPVVPYFSGKTRLSEGKISKSSK